jgi:hypothetical protein|tara:strand:+ start:91 stop:624 length:534 start_codon:yes stop_codon:yes gene_type:complete
MSIETEHAWKTDWSVTRVLQLKWPMPKFIPPEALERGSRVHEISEAIDGGREVEPEEDILGWVSAYQSFIKDFSPRYELVEHIVERPALNCHGVIDRVGAGLNPNGSRFVLDIKTGAKKQADAVQLAAYAMLYDPDYYEQLERYGLYIRRDGSYKLVPYTHDYDYVTWLELLKEATH